MDMQTEGELETGKKTALFRNFVQSQAFWISSKFKNNYKEVKVHKLIEYKQNKIGISRDRNMDGILGLVWFCHLSLTISSYSKIWNCTMHFKCISLRQLLKSIMKYFT